jgi:hydroxymethylbilane synthase
MAFPEDKKTIKIGTRSSVLALWQANWVKGKLEKVFPQHSFQLVQIKTQGDRITDIPLERIGGEGIFIKQIEIALLNGEIDLAVHSMKDVPTVLPDGLVVGTIPERADPADVLISKHDLDLSHLPPGARVGTGSIRRRAQLLHERSDLDMIDIRGNVDTRLAKLRSGELDAIVLASAGIKRLGYENAVTRRIPYSICLPAVGQGALCIEIRGEAKEIHDMVKNIHHPESAAAVRAERAFLKELGGGCRVPIAALGTVKSGMLKLEGLVADRDGRRIIRTNTTGKLEEAERTGERLAACLIDMGARSILESLR